jgi:uncharacterized membrane protein YccC
MRFLLEYALQAIIAVLCIATLFSVILAATEGTYLYLGLVIAAWVILVVMYSKLDRALEKRRDKG